MTKIKAKRESGNNRGVRLLDLRSASKYLSLSYWTLRQMLHRGDLPFVRAGRRILVDRQDLNEWIENSKERY